MPHILTALLTNTTVGRAYYYVCQEHMLKASLNSNESLKLYLSFTCTQRQNEAACEENGNTTRDNIARCNKLLTTLFWFTVSYTSIFVVAQRHTTSSLMYNTENAFMCTF